MFEKARAALGTAAPREALPLLREELPEDEATRAYLFAALEVLAGIDTASSVVEQITRKHLGEVVLGPELADLPGALIQDLIAPAHRRAAGEFYTPRWLAERTVMLSGFPEAEEGVLLDPCCGAGAMLIAAMRLRGMQLTAQGKPPEAIAVELVDRVRGYDLNPLAVLAARVACWAVLGQWIPGRLPALNIVVGDALAGPKPGGQQLLPLEPTVHGSRFAGQALMSQDLVAGQPRTGRHSPAQGNALGGAREKDQKPRRGGIGRRPPVPPFQGSDLVRDISPGLRPGLGYAALSALQDGARVPHPDQGSGERERVGVRADAAFLVGNPPWIRWSEVAPHQADRVSEVARELDLIPRQVWHGGSEVDLSVVIALASSARHLKPGGRSSLVLPRSHLHAPASAPFRRLTLPDGTQLRLEALEDFEEVPAFRGASVKPVIAVWSRGDETHTVTCARYERRSAPSSTTSWAEAASMLRRIDKNLQVSSTDGRWCLVDPGSPMVARLLGETSWVRGRKGVTTDLNEAYFVTVIGPGSAPGVVRVRTLEGRRKLKLPAREFEIESDLLWPLLKGAGQIEAFQCLEEPAAVILPNFGIQNYPSVEQFSTRYPAAAEYFARVERDTDGSLSRRATFRRTFAGRGAPYFLVYNVGDYTFQPFKVVWPEITSRFRAAVALPRAAADGLPERAVVPDHKVYFAAFDQLPPADFLCAFLNSSMVRHAVEASTARLQIGTLLRQIQVPRYDPENPNHAELARSGAQARERGTQPDGAGLDEMVERTLRG